MKTTSYNPSKIELDFANAINGMMAEVQAKLPQYIIQEFIPRMDKDNPDLLVVLHDKDHDRHELVISFIQRPDMF